MVPPEYWTQVGVGLNLALAVVAVIFVLHFVWSV